jgi:hypothetical protein
MTVRIIESRRATGHTFVYRIGGRGPGNKPYFTTATFTGLLKIGVESERGRWGVSTVEISDMKWRLIR